MTNVTSTIELRRRRGVIMQLVSRYDPDRRCWIGKLDIDIEGGPDVCMGTLCFDTGAVCSAFADAIYALFKGAQHPTDLVGLPCWALFNKGEDSMSERVAGIENTHGRRFTIQGFRRAHHQNVPTELDAAKQEIVREITRLERDLATARHKLARLPEGFVEWETAPRGYLIPREPLVEEADLALDETGDRS